MKTFRALPRKARALLCIVGLFILPQVLFFLIFDHFLGLEYLESYVMAIVIAVFFEFSNQVYVSTDDELFEKHSLLRYPLIDRLLLLSKQFLPYLTGIWILTLKLDPNWLKYLFIIPAVLVLGVVNDALVHLFGSEALKEEKLKRSFLFRWKDDRIPHDAVIKPPLFLCDSYGIHPFESLEAAERYFKPKFVADDEALYDSEGRSLRMEVHDHRIVFHANEAYYPEHSEALEEALRDFLLQRGLPEDRLADASLQELVAETMKYGIRSLPA
jgi:hypothetical protein